MGDNKVVYQANPWFSAILALLTVAFALVALWSAVSTDLPDWLQELRLFPAGFRLVAGLLAGLVLAAMCLRYLRLILRPAAIVVGDDGIEASGLSGPSRGLWRDFDEFVQHSGEEGDYVSLHFRRDAGGVGKRVTIGLGGYPGLNRELVVQDATLRLKQMGIKPSWRG